MLKPRRKLPVKVVERAKALAQTRPLVKTAAQEKKAKVVAALKRLHPMD
ncbi:MAG: hypothetical protein H6Q89_57 [Myxococcaceae bacterium]|nr:hypothetical protein [Myxococcaceae bacterium]